MARPNFPAVDVNNVEQSWGKQSREKARRDYERKLRESRRITEDQAARKLGGYFDALLGLQEDEGRIAKDKTSRLPAAPDPLWDALHPNQGVTKEEYDRQQFMDRQRQLTGPLETMPNRPLTVDRLGEVTPSDLTTARTGAFPELDVAYTTDVPARTSAGSTRAKAGIDKSVVDTIMKEAVPGDIDDAKMIASTIANRAALTGASWKSIVSAPAQYSAYGKSYPAGVNIPAQRALVEQAVDDVLQNGPVSDATYYATPSRVGKLPSGLQNIAKTKGHLVFRDPDMRPIKTAQGVAALKPENLTRRSSLLSDIADTGKQAVDAIGDTIGGAMRAIGAGPGQKGGPSKGRLHEAQMAPVSYSMGKHRPNKPNDSITNAIRESVFSALGPGYSVSITSGTEGSLAQFGSNRHKTGFAADFAIIDPQGRVLNAVNDRQAMISVAETAAALGVKGIGVGTDYMGGTHMHFDMVDPGPGQDNEWGNIGNAIKDQLAEARAGAATGKLPDAIDFVPSPRAPRQAPAPSVAEAVQPSPSTAERVQPASQSSLAGLLNPISSASAAEQAPAEKVQGFPTNEHVVGTEPVQSNFAGRPGVISDNSTKAPGMAMMTRRDVAHPKEIAPGFTPDDPAAFFASEAPSQGPIATKDTASLVPPDDVMSPFSYQREAVQPEQTGSINDLGLNVQSPEQTAAVTPAQKVAEALSPINEQRQVVQPAPSQPTVVAPLAPDEETIVSTEVAPIDDPNSALTKAAVTKPKTPVTKAPPLPAPKTVKTLPVAQPKAVTTAAAPAAPAKPSAPALSVNDVLGGAIGQATATDGNIVSHDVYDRTGVTNKYGVTTVTLPDGRQAASSQKGPLTKSSITSGDFFGDLGNKATKNMPSKNSIGGTLLGGLIGAMLGGPGGAAVGAALGRKAANMGSVNDLFPDAPPNPTGAVSGSNRSHGGMSDISPKATADIERGVPGLY